MTNGRTACVGRVWSWSSLVGSTDGGKQWDLRHLQTTCINSLKHSVYENAYIASFLLPFMTFESVRHTLEGVVCLPTQQFPCNVFIWPNSPTHLHASKTYWPNYSRHLYMAGKQEVCFVCGRCFAYVWLQHQTGWKRRDVPPTHMMGNKTSEQLKNSLPTFQSC